MIRHCVWRLITPAIRLDSHWLTASSLDSLHTTVLKTTHTHVILFLLLLIIIIRHRIIWISYWCVWFPPSRLLSVSSRVCAVCLISWDSGAPSPDWRSTHALIRHIHYYSSQTYDRHNHHTPIFNKLHPVIQRFLWDVLDFLSTGNSWWWISMIMNS